MHPWRAWDRGGPGVVPGPTDVLPNFPDLCNLRLGRGRWPDWPISGLQSTNGGTSRWRGSTDSLFDEKCSVDLRWLHNVGLGLQELGEAHLAGFYFCRYVGRVGFCPSDSCPAECSFSRYRALALAGLDVLERVMHIRMVRAYE